MSLSGATELDVATRAHHRFEVLDGWRGIAALCVALYHFAIYSHLYPLAFTRNAYLFVDFFFVLSGFVISYAYGARLDNAGKIAVFVIRRFGRLWPLHIAMLLFLVAIEILKLVATQHHWISFKHVPFDPDGYYSWASIPTNILMIQSFGIHNSMTWNSAAWSVSVEFWTYLVFAALCWLGQRWLIAGGIILVLLGPAVILASGYPNMDVGFDYGIFRCLYGFFIGYFIYRLWRRISALPPGWIGALELPALIVVILFVVYAGSTHVAVLAPILFGPVTLVFAFESGMVSRFMKGAAVQFLGRISYSIYMIHIAVTDLANYAGAALGKLFHRAPEINLPGATEPLLNLGDSPYLGDAGTVLYLLVIVALSAATYRFIERPGQRFFNELAGRWRQRRVQFAG